MRKKLLWILCIGIGLILAVIIVCNVVVVSNSKGKIYNDVEGIPYNRYGLLLGTSPITPSGCRNHYFDNRVNAAANLYNAGKIDFIIASGGDYTKTEKYGCDEPKAIRDSLIVRGIPSDRIILDYDGTRTINSIVKAKDMYGLDSLTVISQEYHNQRAIYLANHFGIEAIGYNASYIDYDRITSHDYSPWEPRRKILKNYLRDYLARVKMFMELMCQ